MKNLAKVFAFLALMCIYLLAAGGPGWRTLFGQKLAVAYGLGAVMALWFGGQSIGILEPTTMRPLFIGLGVLLMIAMFILMMGSRDVMRQLDRGANNSMQRMGASPSAQLQFQRRWGLAPTADTRWPHIV